MELEDGTVIMHPTCTAIVDGMTRRVVNAHIGW
jgi:hypothetical protein